MLYLDNIRSISELCDPATSHMISMCNIELYSSIPKCSKDQFLKHAITNESIQQIQYGLDSGCEMNDSIWLILGQSSNIDIIDYLTFKFTPSSISLYKGIGINGNIEILKKVGWRYDMINSLVEGAFRGNSINMLNFIDNRVEYQWVNIHINYIYNLEALQWLFNKSNLSISNTHIVNNAIIMSNYEMLQWLIDNYSTQPYNIAVSNGNLDIILWLEERGFTHDNETLMYPISIDIVKHIVNRGCITCSHAIQINNLEILQYLYSVNRNILSGYDNFYGCNIETIEWLISIGYSVPNDLFDDAILDDDIELLKYAISHGCKHGEYSGEYLVNNSTKKCLEYLHSIDMLTEMYENLYIQSLYEGDQSLIIWLYDRNYPIPDGIIEKCNLEIVSYMVSKGVKIDYQIIFNYNISIWLHINHQYPLPDNIVDKLCGSRKLDSSIVPSELLQMSLLELILWTNKPLKVISYTFNQLTEINVIKYILRYGLEPNTLCEKLFINAIQMSTVETVQWLIDNNCDYPLVISSNHLMHHSNTDIIDCLISNNIKIHFDINQIKIRNYPLYIKLTRKYL